MKVATMRASDKNNGENKRMSMIRQAIRYVSKSVENQSFGPYVM